MSIQQLCTFNLAGHFFGVNVEQVQEVLRTTEITRVPLAPACVQGLINLRGQILTTIDLRLRLALPPREENDRATYIVVRTTDGAVSLAVDTMQDVLDVAPDSFEKPPETLTIRIRQLISGVYKLDGSLLLVLDTDAAANVIEDETIIAQ